MKVNYTVALAGRQQATCIVDALSMDGSKPLPPIADLVAMDADSLLALRTKTDLQIEDLKSRRRDSTTYAGGRRPAPSNVLVALDRTKAWYAALRQLVQTAELRQRDALRGGTASLPARRSETKAEKAARGESDARAFVTAAKRMLSAEQVAAIWDEVRRADAQ